MAAATFCQEIKLQFYPTFMFFGAGKFHDHDPLSGVVTGPRPTEHDSSAKVSLRLGTSPPCKPPKHHNYFTVPTVLRSDTPLGGPTAPRQRKQRAARAPTPDQSDGCAMFTACCSPGSPPSCLLTTGHMFPPLVLFSPLSGCVHA